MYLVAIAWLYVVMMMAVAEALSSQGTLLGAFFTLLLYGLLPLGLVLYIMGTPLRRRARLAATPAQAPAPGPDAEPAGADARAQAKSTARSRPSQPPDAGCVAPGDAIASKGKEI